MKRSSRLTGIVLAAAGAVFGVAGLFLGVTWVAASGLVLCVASAAVVLRASGMSVAPAPVLHAPPPAIETHAVSAAEPPQLPPPVVRATDAHAERATSNTDRPAGASGRTASARPVAPASAEPADVVTALAENASDAGEVLAAHLWLEDAPSATMRLITAFGTFRPTGDPVAIEGTTLGQALSSGGAAMRAEYHHFRRGERVEVWRFAVPLEVGDARGVAAVDLIGDPPDAAVLGRTVADLRPALTGAVAIHVARQESAAARVLLKTARQLSRLVDVDLVAETLLERALDMAEAETGSVMLLGTDGTLSIAAAAGLPDDVVEETRVAGGEGIAGWVLSTGQPLVVEDLHGRTARSRRHGVRSAVAVPIGDEDGTLGVLNVGARAFAARFSPSHMDALEALGRIGAVALRNARAVESSRDLYFHTLKALALALETKDPYSAGATERILELATALGCELHLDPASQQALRIAALLHDVGMASVGDAVTTVNRPLSTVEWGLLKMHPVIAAEVLAQAPSLHAAIPIVYHHHEHFDGDGYVEGIVGDEIPLGARILAVADAFVAMTSPRPYRRARTEPEALEEMRARSGKQFDPKVVMALCTHLEGMSRQHAPES